MPALTKRVSEALVVFDQPRVAAANHPESRNRSHVPLVSRRCQQSAGRSMDPSEFEINRGGRGIVPLTRKDCSATALYASICSIVGRSMLWECVGALPCRPCVCRRRNAPIAHGRGVKEVNGSIAVIRNSLEGSQILTGDAAFERPYRASMQRLRASPSGSRRE
jgi:hypothetical protein